MATGVIAGLLRRLSEWRGGVRLAIVAFSLILVGVLWTLVLLEQSSERKSAIAAAVQQNSNLALAYEEHVARTLKGLDGVLVLIRREYLRVGRVMDMASAAEEVVSDEHLSATLVVLDERGVVVASSRPMAAVSYAEHDFFRVHQLHRKADALHVGAPIIGPDSAHGQVPLSRPLLRRDGTLAGVIALIVDPAYFMQFYRKAEIGQNGVVSLVGLDGLTRARRVGDRLSVGDNLKGGVLLREQARAPVGDFIGSGIIDGVTRYVSYRTVPRYSLLVLVGTASDEVLASFVRSRNRDMFLAVLMTIIITAFSAMLVVAVRRQERSAIALATSEARFRATFEEAAIGISHTSLDRKYLAVNRKFCDMLGYTRDELIGRSAASVTPVDDEDDEEQLREQLLREGAESVAAEKRYQRKDGTVFWVNRTVSLVRDAGGEPLYFLRVVEDIDERKRLQGELLELAATDALTGLPNRRTFIGRLEEEFERVRRFPSQHTAVLMLDLDHFKRINDSCGHAAGDEVLRQVGMLIRDETRRVDLCSRLGGEEFAILLAGAVPAQAGEFAERLRGKIADAAIVYEGRMIAVTASIGVAAMKADDDSADAALMRADRALYQAKDSGRNQVRLAAEPEQGAAGAAA